MPRLDALFGPVPIGVARYSTLDGFRALAIVLLVVGHYARDWPEIPGFGDVNLPVGSSIVALFVLTGFLATERLLHQWDRTGDIAVVRYWIRKIIRFYPVFAVFVLFTSVHHVLVGVDVPAARVWTVLGLTGNYYYALARDDPSRHIIGHLWSVAVGAQFLVVWPFVLRMFLRRGWLHWLVYGGFALALASATLRTMISWYTSVPANYPYLATESRVDALLIGALFALSLRDIPVVRTLAAVVAHPAATWVAVAGLVGSLAGSGRYQMGPGFSVEAVLTAILIVAALRAERRGAWGWLRSRPMRLISVTSFSLFLWHLYSLTADSWLPPGTPFLLRILFTLTITGLVGALSYVVLERPFQRLAFSLTQPHSVDADPAEPTERRPVEIA